MNAIKAGLLGNQRSSPPVAPPSISATAPDSDYPDTFRRQASLSGEDIKIVIDDVDQIELDQSSSKYFLHTIRGLVDLTYFSYIEITDLKYRVFVTDTDVSPVRRVILRRDPNERIHKSKSIARSPCTFQFYDLSVPYVGILNLG